jgi:hypothetical protein
MHLMTQAKSNVSALELMRHVGVSYPTAWLLKHKIMHVIAAGECGRQLTGRVEIDEAHLGGEVRRGKAGRGSPNKVPCIAAVKTSQSGQPVLVCLSPRQLTKESIKACAQQSLAVPATQVSDGLGCIQLVHAMGIEYKSPVTGGGAALVKGPTFLAVNTALGNIKPLLAGTAHAFGFQKYASSYLGQIQYLFSRRFNLRESLKQPGRGARNTSAYPLRAIWLAQSLC